MQNVLIKTLQTGGNANFATEAQVNKFTMMIGRLPYVVYQSQGLFDTQETIIERFLTMGPVHLRAQCAGGVEAAVPRHGSTVLNQVDNMGPLRFYDYQVNRCSALIGILNCFSVLNKNLVVCELHLLQLG